MKSVILLPYCPLPVDSGARGEMWKHLRVLGELGACTVLSARSKPVGSGWTPADLAQTRAAGFEVVLRDTGAQGPGALFGLAYAAACKALGLERAFGHANPYHRYAFDPAWWRRHTREAELAVINYSYWARLPCRCPKALVLHDLLSDAMWGSVRRETDELKRCDLVVVISTTEFERLRERGVERVLWSPPAIEPADLPDSDQVAIVGSANRFNVEGCRWLERAARRGGLAVRVYGDLAGLVGPSPPFERVGRYQQRVEPYRHCGIVLMTARQGMGVQVKGVEALAAGRAIVARRGSMRGLPPGEGAWVEVDTPEQLVDAALALAADPRARGRQCAAARRFYDRHLQARMITAQLRDAYAGLAARRCGR